jgi:WD40 repeat protein
MDSSRIFICIGSRRFVRERTPTSQDLNQLENSPRLQFTIRGDFYPMAANDKYLLYCPKNSLCVIDADGHEILDVEREFEVYDICWSSYKNRFLILDTKQLYSLNRKTKKCISVLDFDKKMYSCTCYEDTLLVSRYHSNTIEAYKMKNWKLIQTIKPSDLKGEDQNIRQIRYDIDGNYLGLLVKGRHSNYSFELRDADDLEMLFRRVDLDCKCPCDIVLLPDDQFLISLSKKKKCVLIDTDGELKETINYSQEVQSIAFIGNKKNCLVIQTDKPAKLRFHDLKD